MTKVEIWKEVEGWPTYEVSNLGRVRCLGTVYRAYKFPKVRAQVWIKKYLCVCLCFAQVRRTVAVHRLVARAFIGPVPSGKQVNHKDADRENNSADNLEYCTLQENISHAMKLGIHSCQKRVAR